MRRASIGAAAEIEIQWRFKTQSAAHLSNQSPKRTTRYLNVRAHLGIVAATLNCNNTARSVAQYAAKLMHEDGKAHMWEFEDVEGRQEHTQWE